MKACITGANGFIGRYLCSRLVQEGWDIRALVLPHESTEFIQNLGIEIQRGNLLEPESLQGFADNCQVIFHLAARVVDHGSRKQFYQAIFDGTANLLTATGHKDRHFIFASSIAAFGLKDHLSFPDESNLPRKTGIFYGDAKLDAEMLIKDYHRAHGMEFTLIRPCNVTGPGSVWVRYPLQKLQEWSGLPLIEEGKYHACLLEVRSLVDAFFRAATRPEARGQTYFLMDDWEINWQQYFTDLGKWVKKKPGPSLPYSLAWNLSAGMEFIFSPLGLRLPLSRIGAALTGRDNRVNTQKAQKELGWKSLMSYEEAMKDIEAWARKEGLAKKF